MALQMSKTIEEYGVSLNSAYIRVEGFEGNKTSTIASVVIYSDVDARNSNKNPVKQFTISVATPTTDMLPALYNYLKTLPEFSGALDV